MRIFKKGAALALAAVMALSSAQLAVFADDTATGLPRAVVTELTGADLDVTIDDYSGFGGVSGGDYTMNKAVMFSTNYETNDKGELTVQGQKDQDADLETYGKWICDFRINFDIPGGELKGDDLTLVGNYGGWGNVAFTPGDLLEMYNSQLPEENKMTSIPASNNDYYLMQILSAATGVSNMANLTYNEVATLVKNFKCGIIDNDLPIGTTVTVQLVMYEDYARTPELMHEIGDPVIYAKRAKPNEPETEVIPVGDLDSEVEEVAADGVPNLTVEGIKDAMIATEKTKLINDYIVEKNVEKPEQGTLTVDVDIYAKTKALAENKFELTPYAEITCNGKPTANIEISNDQLKNDASIKVVVPSAEEPIYILHHSDGYPTETYTKADTADDEHFSYSNGYCTLYISHFSDLELITDDLMVTDKDAYIVNGVTGNLRFITTYYGTDTVEKFGTWIVPGNIFTDNTGAMYTNTENASLITSDSTFTADLMNIPSDMFNTQFYAKSYVKINGQEKWTKDSAEIVISRDKNSTSN